MLHLGFLSPHNSYDRRAFSGTVYHAARALEATPGVSVRILGDYRAPSWRDRLRRPFEIKDVSDLEVGGLDAVVGMVASPLLNRLATVHLDLPVFHITDATPRFLSDAYGWTIPVAATETERRLVGQARRVIYSSEVMAARAPGDLGLPGLDPAVIPFGVNLETLPDHCPQKAPLAPLNLLFVGLDWVRKGGDHAVATLDVLKARGIEARLTVIGRCPAQYTDRPDVINLGYLNKNRFGDLKKITKAYKEAHFLLLPSRADCTPMVVGEALAHGTPVVATDVGGIGPLIGPGAGLLMPEFSSPEEWAGEIAALMRRPERYAFLSDAGFDRTQSLLSWPVWAKDVTDLIATDLASDWGDTVVPLQRRAS